MIHHIKNHTNHLLPTPPPPKKKEEVKIKINKYDIDKQNFEIVG